MVLVKGRWKADVWVSERDVGSFLCSVVVFRERVWFVLMVFFVKGGFIRIRMCCLFLGRYWKKTLVFGWRFGLFCSFGGIRIGILTCWFRVLGGIDSFCRFELGKLEDIREWVLWFLGCFNVIILDIDN